MKRFLIAFFGIVFLLPAYVSAGSYCVSFPWDGNSIWSTRDNDIKVRFRVNNKFGSGVIDGENEPRPRGDLKAYTTFHYRDPNICLETDILGAVGSGKSGHGDKDIKIRLDVKWGGDCPTVTAKNHQLSGDHKFQIYRRKGDHINPWNCSAL